MNLRKLILTENECYTKGRTIRPSGVMIHSTGTNNPNLRRYVGPDDGLLGASSSHWNQPRPGGRQVCVHAFIGKLADGSVAAYQILPWGWRGWHCGSGPNGTANDTHIGFEICEDGLEDASYFSAAYREAVELTAHLCNKFELDPLADGVVICHAEGHRRGVASNHADVLHWFPRFGKNMDDFRADVARTMREEEIVTQEQFDTMMENWLARQNAKQPTQSWQLEGLERAKAVGITDGSRPLGICTRLEAAMMAAASHT